MHADFRLGDWIVDPRRNQLVRIDAPEHPVQIDNKSMAVLICLADRAGEVVPKDTIIALVWRDVFVSDEVLTNAVYEIRKALGDDSKSPRYVQTVPREGYRVIADVSGSVPRGTNWPVVAAAVLGVAFFAVAWRFWTSAPPPVDVTSTTVVAVLPFTVRGSEDVAYLGEGMADLLGATLDTGSQRTVDPKTLLRFVGEDEVDPERGREVAQRFGARRYVLGSVVEAGGRLRIQSTLYDASLGGGIIARASAEGEYGELFSMVDDITAQLLIAAAPVPEYALASAMTTESLEALEAYLEGEDAIRNGHSYESYKKAFPHFQRAVALDPEFALAWSRLAVVASPTWGTTPLAAEYGCGKNTSRIRRSWRRMPA